MDELVLKQIIEALLFSAESPLSVAAIQAVFDDWQKPDTHLITELLQQLAKTYESCVCELIQTASGWRFQTKKQYSVWINRLHAEKPARYSRALLETIAIIAYKQPVTRADIEQVRGVSVSTSIIKTLLDREWIRTAGYRDLPGKPAVYVTTKAFLDYFNLQTLAELPLLTDNELPLPVQETFEETV